MTPGLGQISRCAAAVSTLPVFGVRRLDEDESTSSAAVLARETPGVDATWTTHLS
jgi:hypothetical protein